MGALAAGVDAQQEKLDAATAQLERLQKVLSIEPPDPAQSNGPSSKIQACFRSLCPRPRLSMLACQLHLHQGSHLLGSN